MVQQEYQSARWRFLYAGIFLVALTAWLLAGGTSAQESPMHHDDAGHQGMSMPMDDTAPAKILADKKESEFNHHLAGFFVLIAGIFTLFQAGLTRRWPAARYAWSACFLFSGIFVLVWSDTELWPFGQRQWLEALQNNREVLQHKTFALLLLALGAIEWQRARGVLRAAWSAWVFPLVAVAGSVLLIFHQHAGGMVGEHHMETMARIQSEHLSYTLSGLGIALTKGLSELKSRSSPFFAKVWPSLMVVLGVLLMFYRE